MQRYSCCHRETVKAFARFHLQPTTGQRTNHRRGTGCEDIGHHVWKPVNKAAQVSDNYNYHFIVKDMVNTLQAGM